MSSVMSWFWTPAPSTLVVRVHRASRLRRWRWMAIDKESGLPVAYGPTQGYATKTECEAAWKAVSMANWEPER